jgi:hypothetical protein
MVLKERVRIVWGSIFLVIAIGLTIYFISLAVQWKISTASTILALLAAVLALTISLFNNVKLRNKWKK